MKFQKRALLATSLCALLGMNGSALATNGYFSHAFSMKEAGMAGAGVANADKDADSLAGATNPANLVFVGKRVDFGTNLFSPQREYEVQGQPAIPAFSGVISGGGLGPGSPCPAPGVQPCQLPFSLAPGKVKSDKNLFVIPHFGWNTMLNNKTSVGIMVYGNGGMNTTWQSGSAFVYNPQTDSIGQAPGTFGAGDTGVDLMQLFVAPSIAHKIGKNSSIGASLILAYQRFEAEGLGNFAGVVLDPTKLTNNDHDDAFGYGLKLGFNLGVTEGMRLGASWQSKVNFDKFSDYSSLFAEGGNFDVPATWTIGISADVGETGTLLVDLQRINYTDVKALENGIDPLLSGQCLDALNATLFNGGTPTGASGPGCGGGPNGFGFGWDNMSIVKVGYQWQHNKDWTLRVGYSKTNQPIGESEVIFNILAPAVIEDHFTAGFTKKLSNGNELTFAAMYGAGTDVTGPNPFDPGQTITLRMDQYQIGISYGMK